jgi:hypothetical protein
MLYKLAAAVVIFVITTPAFAQSYTPQLGGANIVNTPAAERTNGRLGRGPNAIQYDSKGRIHAGRRDANWGRTYAYERRHRRHHHAH